MKELQANFKKLEEYVAHVKADIERLSKAQVAPEPTVPTQPKPAGKFDVVVWIKQLPTASENYFAIEFLFTQNGKLISNEAVPESELSKLEWDGRKRFKAYYDRSHNYPTSLDELPNGYITMRSADVRWKQLWFTSHVQNDNLTKLEPGTIPVGRVQAQSTESTTAPAVPTSDSFQDAMRAAMAATTAGHEVMYKGWRVHGAPGIQGRGGAIVMGGAFVLANMRPGSQLMNSALDGSMTHHEVQTRLHRPFDRISPWGCFVPGEGTSGAWVNARNFRVYVLYKGESKWRKIIDTPTIAGAWACDQTHSMQPWDSANLVNSSPPNAPIEYHRDGYLVTRTPMSDMKNNHWGAGDIPLPNNFDANKVEGVYVTLDCRLDERNPHMTVGLQLGCDLKFSDLHKPWYPGLGLTKLLKLDKNWKTFGWVNFNGGQDAERGGLVLSAERLLSTSL